MKENGLCKPQSEPLNMYKVREADKREKRFSKKALFVVWGICVKFEGYSDQRKIERDRAGRGLNDVPKEFKLNWETKRDIAIQL